MPRYLADKAAADKQDLPHCGKKQRFRRHFRRFRDWARTSNCPNLVPGRPGSGQMNEKLKTYIKRMGLAAFLFFFLKGLAWIAVFYFGWQMFD